MKVKFLLILSSSLPSPSPQVSKQAFLGIRKWLGAMRIQCWVASRWVCASLFEIITEKEAFLEIGRGGSCEDPMLFEYLGGEFYPDMEIVK